VKTDLFHISTWNVARLCKRPEEYSQGVKSGMTADLSLAEGSGRKSQGNWCVQPMPSI
jgi:hypothetical protein